MTHKTEKMEKRPCIGPQQRGNLQAAKLLIAKGAKVNVGRTKDEKTALDLAEDRAFLRNDNAFKHYEFQHVEVANLFDFKRRGKIKWNSSWMVR